jgi:hypothetical protein
MSLIAITEVIKTSINVTLSAVAGKVQRVVNTGASAITVTMTGGSSFVLPAGYFTDCWYDAAWYTDSVYKIYSNPIPLLSNSGKIIKNGSADSILVPPFEVKINGTDYALLLTATLTTADLDTGSAFTFGADHYIWAGEPASETIPVLKISLSATSPVGMTNPKIIGGFHFGKIRNSFTASDVSNGILANSVWDLSHMPKCYLLGLSDPATYQLGGMVEVIPGSLWVDIYLASDGGGTLPNKRVYSKINVVPITGTEGLNWYDFVARGRVVGKRMLTYAEWTAAALGSPQGIDASNLNGWTKTTNTGRVKTGATASGDSDTNYILGYNTSLLNVRDCVGNVWEWLADLSNRHDTTVWAWHDVLDAGELAASSDFGQARLPNADGLVAYLAGGLWTHGVIAGARAVYVGAYPWYVNTDIGCRFACDSL